MLEKEIQRGIVDYLRFKRYCYLRNNTGAFKDERGHFYRFGEIGSPDLFVFHSGRAYGIEVKTSKGKQSDYQKDWQKNFERAGCVYILARSIDDVMKYL